jgi:anti-sigma regulatory factor (Ser/Thr protein kinase)
MNEVLSNLLSNAFKFTSGGGQVELTVSHGDGGEQTMQLVVVDSGAGIPPEQLAHIFDKFFQASNQGAASAKGSGLGLAIAREIVGAHGGQIQVESEVGRGTRFTIDVPTHATEAGELPLESPSAGAGGRGAPAKRRIAGPEPHAKRAARDDAPHELTGSGRVDGGRRAADALADPR